MYVHEKVSRSVQTRITVAHNIYPPVYVQRLTTCRENIPWSWIWTNYRAVRVCVTNLFSFASLLNLFLVAYLKFARANWENYSEFYSLRESKFFSQTRNRDALKDRKRKRLVHSSLGRGIIFFRKNLGNSPPRSRYDYGTWKYLVRSIVVINFPPRRIVEHARRGSAALRILSLVNFQRQTLPEIFLAKYDRNRDYFSSKQSKYILVNIANIFFRSKFHGSQKYMLTHNIC